MDLPQIAAVTDPSVVRILYMPGHRCRTSDFLPASVAATARTRLNPKGPCRYTPEPIPSLAEFQPKLRCVELLMSKHQLVMGRRLLVGHGSRLGQTSGADPAAAQGQSWQTA